MHDAGPWTVFDWPERYGIHPREKLQGGEWFSVEFRTRTAVPEWGNQLVSMQREEDMVIPQKEKAGPLKTTPDRRWSCGSSGSWVAGDRPSQ